MRCFGVDECEHPYFKTIPPTRGGGSMRCPDCDERLTFIGLDLYERLMKLEEFEDYRYKKE